MTSHAPLSTKDRDAASGQSRRHGGNGSRSPLVPLEAQSWRAKSAVQRAPNWPVSKQPCKPPHHIKIQKPRVDGAGRKAGGTPCPPGSMQPQRAWAPTKAVNFCNLEDGKFKVHDVPASQTFCAHDPSTRRGGAWLASPFSRLRSAAPSLRLMPWSRGYLRKGPPPSIAAVGQQPGQGGACVHGPESFRMSTSLRGMVAVWERLISPTARSLLVWALWRPGEVLLLPLLVATAA